MNVVVTTNSTSLVETVNINLDDFSETFLTCSTCLYTYDQDTRKPKLLPCSHSVCLFCVTQLAALSRNAEPPSVRCPLCRDVCILPPGGVNSFPAAFFINQLLDVMQKQRKDIVPSCTIHPSDQLLYCETCDLVFCERCQTSITNKKCTEHTVVPLSIAIKRTSEIVVYRAKNHLKALDNAHVAVSKEIEQLDGNVDSIVEQINAAIQEVSNLVESRRRELIEAVRVLRDEKRKVLKDQIETIFDERKKMEKELESCQVDIRAMAKTLRDQESNENWQRQMVEPRENAFLRINTDSHKLLVDVEKNLSEFGKVYASTTFPGTSTIDVPKHVAVNIENTIQLRTRDVQGQQRKTGGDPLEVELTGPPTILKEEEENEPTKVAVVVSDNSDGTYDIDFRVTDAGTYSLSVKIFGRPVKNSPLTIDVAPSHAPLWQLPVQLNKPTKVLLDAKTDVFYVLDSGNNRVRLVKENGDVVNDVTSDALKGGTAVGLVLLPGDEMAVLNWQKKSLTRLNTRGETIKSVNFSEFEEPIDVTMDSRGRYIIGDNHKVFILNSSMVPIMSFPVKEAGRVNCVGVGLDDDILVGTTTELLLYDGMGKRLRHIATYPPKHSGRVSIHSVACCQQTGLIVAGVTDKRTNRTSLAISNYKGVYQYTIESPSARISAPSGLLLQPSSPRKGQVFVADHNINNVRMFKYK